MKVLKTIDTLILFFVLILLTILLGETAIYMLDLNQLLYKDLSEQLTIDQIETLFNTKAEWAWVSYVVLPLLLFLKITVIAWILAIGGFFTDTSLDHKAYFQIVLKAEFVFLLAIVFKIIWFKFIAPDSTFEQVQQFVPLSLQHIIDTGNVPQWGLYPLQLINIFELAYWLVLSVLISKATKMGNGLKIVAMGYGPALFIWVVFIMFLTLNLS